MKNDSTTRRANGGFTLLEVLIAMVLLSVGFVGIHGLTMYALRGVVLAERRDAYVAEASRVIEATNSALKQNQITSFPVRDSIALPGAVLRREVACTVVSNSESAIGRQLRTRVTVVAASSASLSTQLDSHLYDPNQASC